jgi:O-antigen ligase
VNRYSRTLTLVCLIGLFASLISASAVLAAERRVLSQTTTASYTSVPGEAKWEGDWEFSELGADPSQIGSQAGTDRVTIPFVGTDLALQVRRGDFRGNLFVSVDGEPANQLPREERGAYLVLTSPDYTPHVVTIPVASGLADGPHEAVVVADRGWAQWPLVGWSASRTPDTTAYRWALTAWVVLGFVCLVGTIWGIRGRQEREVSSRYSGGYNAVAAISSMLCMAGAASRSFPNRAYLPRLLDEIRRGDRIPSSQPLILILLAAAVFYFSPWLPLTFLAGLALAVLVVLRIDLGLALVAATAPFYLYPRHLFGKSFSMAEILVLLCALSWGIRRISIRRSLISTLQSLVSLDLAALSFVLVAIASSMAAEYRHVALRELRVVVLEPALFYWMLRTSRLNNGAMWRVMDSFVLGGVVVALVGLVQFGLGVNIITAEEGFRRLRSVYGSPNNVGLYLGRVLPVLVAVALFGAARGRRAAYGTAAVPVALAVLLSFSKGALILGVPLSLLTLGVLAGGSWLRVSLGVLAATVVAAVPLLRTPRFASLFDIRAGTSFFRLQLWRSSWMMFRDHPRLGVGLDNFLYQYRSRYILPAAWQEPDLSHPHNVFLDYGCRLGLCGLAAGAWLQVAFWPLALPLRRLADRDRRALALGLMGSMAGFLAHGLVDASYFVIDLAFAFFLTLGVVQWLTKEPEE